MTNINEYKNPFSYFANADNNVALNFLAQSIIDRFDDNPRISELKSEALRNMFIDLHNNYINQLAYGILYRNKLKNILY